MFTKTLSINDIALKVLLSNTGRCFSKVFVSSNGCCTEILCAILSVAEVLRNALVIEMDEEESSPLKATFVV